MIGPEDNTHSDPPPRVTPAFALESEQAAHIRLVRALIRAFSPQEERSVNAIKELTHTLIEQNIILYCAEEWVADPTNPDKEEAYRTQQQHMIELLEWFENNPPIDDDIDPGVLADDVPEVAGKQLSALYSQKVIKLYDQGRKEFITQIAGGSTRQRLDQAARLFFDVLSYTDRVERLHIEFSSEGLEKAKRDFEDIDARLKAAKKGDSPPPPSTPPPAPRFQR